MLGLHPEQQLKIVQGLRPRRRAYSVCTTRRIVSTHFLASSRSRTHFSYFAAWSLFTPFPWVQDCAELCWAANADIHVAVASLQSVVDCTSGKEIHFLHASLPDFLFDRDRSLEFYLHRPFWATRLSVLAFKFVMSGGNQGIPAILISD